MIYQGDGREEGAVLVEAAAPAHAQAGFSLSRRTLYFPVKVPDQAFARRVFEVAEALARADTADAVARYEQINESQPADWVEGEGRTLPGLGQRSSRGCSSTSPRAAGR